MTPEPAVSPTPTMPNTMLATARITLPSLGPERRKLLCNQRGTGLRVQPSPGKTRGEPSFARHARDPWNRENQKRRIAAQYRTIQNIVDADTARGIALIISSSAASESERLLF